MDNVSTLWPTTVSGNVTHRIDLDLNAVQLDIQNQPYPLPIGVPQSSRQCANNVSSLYRLVSRASKNAPTSSLYRCYVVLAQFVTAEDLVRRNEVGNGIE